MGAAHTVPSISLASQKLGMRLCLEILIADIVAGGLRARIVRKHSRRSVPVHSGIISGAMVSAGCRC